MPKLAADTVLDRVNRIYKFGERFKIYSPKCMYYFDPFEGWTIVPAADGENRRDQWIAAKNNEELKKFYFGNAAPGGFFSTAFGTFTYTEFDRVNIRRIYAYVTGEALAEIDAVCNYLTKNPCQDIEGFIQYAEFVDNFFSKYDYNLENVINSLDNLRANVLAGDAKTNLRDNICYCIRNKIFGSGLLSLDLGNSVLFKIPRNVTCNLAFDMINPWTQEIMKNSPHMDHVQRGKHYTLAELQDIPVQMKNTKPKRPVARLKPVNGLIGYNRLNMVETYPPMPIIPGIDKPIRREGKVQEVGTYLFMGVELELNYAGPGNIPGLDNDHIRASHAVMKQNPNVCQLFYDISSRWQVLPQHDGTVSGPEFVSSPATINAHSIVWYEILELLRESKLFDVDINAAVHVHVNREVFTPIVFGKVYRFINQKSNKTFIDKICGRPMSPHCFRKETSISTSLTEAQTKRVAVNNYKEGTIEFRLFKSTLDYTKFMSYLEFISALINWMYEDLPSFQDMKPEIFIAYVKRYRRTYCNLATVLVLEGLL